MLEEALLMAASTGATTLVTAMATDGWQAARDGVARLLGRGEPARQAAVESRLDEHEAAVRGADDTDALRERLAAGWRTDLELLLERSPEALQELRVLTAQIQGALSPAQQAWVSAHTIVQHINASGQGSIAGGAIGGNVIFHGRDRGHEQ
ncbi:hypothetical protein WEI85_19715 [Actinomycetes bacterium KLBMP 9797]